MKEFKQLIKDCVEMTLTVKYDEDSDTLSFYNDKLLMEQFTVKELLEHKITRLVAGQIFPAGKKAHKVYNALLDFMYDEHEEIYDTIKMNDEFIEFLENIVKED